MYQTEVFKLLTEEYKLILAHSSEHIDEIKKIRTIVFATKYGVDVKQEKNKSYIFNQDDEQSFNYLLYHVPTQTYVGTVRNFFVNNKTPTILLPMQRYGNVQKEVIENSMYAFPICEISRLALVKELPQSKNYSTLRLRTLLTYGLMIATRINFLLYPYTMVFSIMEPSLHRILKRQQVKFSQIGKQVDYYGICIPYSIKTKELLHDTEETMGSITHHYLKELCQNPDSFWNFIDNNPYLKRTDIQLDRICQLFKENGDDVNLSLLIGEDTLS